MIACDPLPPINFSALAQALLARADTLVPLWLPGGKLSNGEYLVHSAWRSEKTPSLSVRVSGAKAGCWGDFGGDHKGNDLIGLYAALHGLDNGKAAVQLARELGLEDVAGVTKGNGAAPMPRPAAPAAVAPRPRPVEPWVTVVPVPEIAPKATFKHQYRLAEDIVHVAAYMLDGALHGYVVRFRTSDGGKDTLPYVWSQSTRDGTLAWRWRTWAEPRPLYLPGGVSPAAAKAAGRAVTVVVVEGERKADILQALLDAGAPRNDVTVLVSLPLPVVTIKFIPPARAELLAELPALTVSTLLLRPSVPLSVAGASLPGVVFSGEVRYYSRTQRLTVGQTEHPWQVARQTEDGSTQGQQDAAATPAGWDAFWRRTLGVPQGIEHKLPPVLVAAPEQRGARHQDATRLQDSTWFAHQDATHFELARQGLFQNAVSLRDATRFRHQDGDRSKRAGRVALWQTTILVTRGQASDFQSARPELRGWRGRYQEAVPPPPGISRWVVPVPPVPQPCYTPSTHLLFAALTAIDSHLLFVCENHINPPPPDGEPVVVPVRRVYFVINNVTLHRVPDGTPVPVFNLSLSLDAASWAWGVDAVLPAKAESLVAPGNGSGPVELVASVNGTAFRVLAENISRERSFGDASIRISGRGRNAVLAAPYAPVMTFSNAEGRTARQLMDDVLTVNGIPLGWAVDWGLTDWNIPAGVFAQQGTWIEALTAIAGAAGGYLIPHPSTQTIRVRHRYPVAPWEWSTVTPDIVLPVDAVARESLRWLEKPAYNRVFVSGQDVGVLGQVTRAGTAGDVLAPMVVDPLITEAAAARQRGIAVLSDTGHQIEVSLRLPVLAETGIIEPGAFVEYQDGSVTRLGLVRATQVEAGMPEVWQTLGVQAYA